MMNLESQLEQLRKSNSGKADDCLQMSNTGAAIGAAGMVNLASQLQQLQQSSAGIREDLNSLAVRMGEL
jgi:hypothetical protein